MRSASELRDLMDTLQRKKIALENSLRANGNANPSYFSVTQVSTSPPTTPTSSPAMSSSAYQGTYQEQARRFYSSDRPPVSLKSGSHLPPGRRSDPLTSSRGSVSRSQDNRGISDSRRLNNPGSSPLLTTWNGGGSSTSVASSDNVHLSVPPSSTSRAPSAGGAASMPSSPRLGRRTYGNQDPSPTIRTRKYSAGSLSGLMTGGHSRSLPRLCPSPSPRGESSGMLHLSTLPQRQANMNGSYKIGKESFSHNPNANPEYSHSSTNSFQQVSSKNHIQTNTQGEGVVSISLSSPKNSSSSTYSTTMGLGETRASFGKAGTDHGTGFGERRQSFGKAGVAPPGGFRERRGSISSLSGKEELTDYHHRQKEERLREQEVVYIYCNICLRCS
uniref:Uncharacterized protein n=1 Tax=Xiphophorus couchianus TaxID=32473 RepID=A0A3B5LGK6_9TELE